VARTGIFAQTSLSHLGDNSRSSSWFLLELSLRRRASVLSDESSRSSKKVSLKRELFETCCALCSHCRSSEGLQFWAKGNFAQARTRRMLTVPLLKLSLRRECLT